MGSLYQENLVYWGATWAGSSLLLLLLHLQERVTSRHIAQKLGWRGVLLTGWLGVPIHELSHLLLAAAFGHRIIAWKLFDPDPSSGTLGYVRHAYRRRNPWQLLGGFLISVAPVVGGALALGGLCCWIIPPQAWGAIIRVASSGRGIMGRILPLSRIVATTVWSHRTGWLPLQIYLGICITSHMAPSKADLKGGLPGGLFALLASAGAVMWAARLGHTLTGGALVLALLLLLLLTATSFQAIYVATVDLVLRLQSRHRRNGASLTVGE